MTLTKEQLETRFEGWQDALSLRDWGLVLEFENLTKGLGECRSYPGKKTATVVLRDPAYLRGDEADIEQEQALVQELLHLHFAAFDSIIPPHSVTEAVLEQALSAIAETLVELARAARETTVAAAGE